MPIVREGGVGRGLHASGSASKKKKLAAAAGRPEQGLGRWTSSIARGEKVYAANCVACHQAHRQGLPARIPALDGSQDRRPAPKDGADRHRAATASRAPRWRRSASSCRDTEIAAVITLQAQHLGQQGRRIVQPAEVKARAQIANRRTHMSAVIDNHDTPRPRSRPRRSRPRRTTAATAGSCAGSPRPTTRTSARCTCGSRSSMFIVGGVMALVIRAELFQPACSSSTRSSSTS